LEWGFSLDDLFDEAFRFGPDMLALNMQGIAQVDKRLESQANELIQRLPENMQKTMKARLAVARFLKGVDFTFKFANLAEFVELVPAFNPDDNPMGLRPASVQELKDGIARIADMPVAQTLQAMMVPMSASLAHIPPPFNQIYNLVQQNLVGLRRIHIQLHAHTTRVDFVGLDFIKFLPDPNVAAGQPGQFDGNNDYNQGPLPAGYDGSNAYSD
jgi:hypothetical protein